MPVQRDAAVLVELNTASVAANIPGHRTVEHPVRLSTRPAADYTPVLRGTRQRLQDEDARDLR